MVWKVINILIDKFERFVKVYNSLNIGRVNLICLMFMGFIDCFWLLRFFCNMNKSGFIKWCLVVLYLY